jgi:hypothetical protein
MTSWQEIFHWRVFWWCNENWYSLCLWPILMVSKTRIVGYIGCQLFCTHL